jgi:hypothetical protein
MKMVSLNGKAENRLSRLVSEVGQGNRTTGPIVSRLTRPGRYPYTPDVLDADHLQKRGKAKEVTASSGGT